MTRVTDLTLSKPICYAVIDADRGDSGIRIRHQDPSAEFTRGQHLSTLQVRFSLAGASPPGVAGNTFDAAGYAQLRLAIDVTRDLHGYPRRLPHAIAAEWGLVALTGPHGPFNRVATELLHRLDANLDTCVYGPLALHAAPDSRQHIGSLSDRQLRRMARLTVQISRAIECRKDHAGSTQLPPSQRRPVRHGADPAIHRTRRTGYPTPRQPADTGGRTRTRASNARRVRQDNPERDRTTSARNLLRAHRHCKCGGDSVMLPFRRRPSRAITDTPMPRFVPSLVSLPEHIPQPDVEAQRRFAARLRSAGIDAPIDATARCRCGRPIVDDEVHGWLHLATAEQAATSGINSANLPR